MFYEPIDECGGFKLVKRPDSPYYHITHYVPGTRRLRRASTRTADLDAARAKLRRLAAARGRVPKKTPTETPILEILGDYVERKGPPDARRYAIPAAFKAWVRFVEAEGLAMLDELTLETQDRYVQWRTHDLVAAGYAGSTGTLRRELGVLKAAVRDAWKRGRLTEVPYIRSAPMPRGRQRYLSADEARRLLAACVEPHIELFVLLALHTLQRPRAILELRTAQVDLASSRIDFHPPGTAETAKRRPVVPIGRRLRPHLEGAVEQSVSGFVIEYRGRPVGGVRAGFNTARAAAELGRDVTPYTLRHTGATLMAAAGVPMRQISGMLGHSHSKTTELYAKHAPEYLGQAVATLDELFGGGEPSDAQLVQAAPLRGNLEAIP